MNITNVQVHNFEQAIKASKYPMAVDVNKLPPTQDIEYWRNMGAFLDDFIQYQNAYDKPTGKDTPESCYYCGSNTSVQMNSSLGHYVCAKHNHQLERYGECFETSPKYIVHDEYVECVIYGKKRREITIRVNAIDLPLLFYGDSVSTTQDGRPQIYNKTEKKNTLLYRAICNVDNSNTIVDHIDGDVSNNCRDNLRICISAENNRNKKVTNNNTSDVIGVSWSSNRNKWRAYIVINYKQKHLGYYTQYEDAVMARLIAEREHFKEYAPQQYLFEQYGVEPVDTQKSNVDYNRSFKEVLRMYTIASKLGNTSRGKAEDNYLNGIVVSFDLTCSNKMWVEFQRYHFAEIISSQSTMHKIKHLLLAENIFNEYVVDDTKKVISSLLKQYNENPTTENYLRLLYNTPSGIELTAHIVTNYGQLKTMWYQRHNHRLPEWRRFCEWILGLKEFKTLTGIKEKE